jgi:hypothetical protein
MYIIIIYLFCGISSVNLGMDNGSELSCLDMNFDNSDLPDAHSKPGFFPSLQVSFSDLLARYRVQSKDMGYSLF